MSEVETLIKSKAVLIISKTFCPHCKRTRQVNGHKDRNSPSLTQVLDGYSLNPDKVQWLEIDLRNDMDAIQRQMKQVFN